VLLSFTTPDACELEKHDIDIVAKLLFVFDPLL
jgi:hypothetical protein